MCMQSWYEANVLLHAAAGGLGLVSMLVPLLARKGGRLHRRAGWVFTLAMGIVAVTGLAIAAAWLLAPLGAKPPERVLDPEATARYVEGLRRGGVFFGFLAVLVGSAAWNGVVATRQRRGVIAWGNPIDLGFAWAVTGLGTVLLVASVAWGQPVFMGFGVLGLVTGVSDLRFFRHGRNEKSAWLRRHLQAMLGGATAATTAFTVQVVGRMLDDAGFGQWMIAAWLLPVAAGTGLSVWWSRRVRPGLRRGYARG
jgi:hypothetical protein